MEVDKTECEDMEVDRQNVRIWKTLFIDSAYTMAGFGSNVDI
jgi:hypothetical protein